MICPDPEPGLPHPGNEHIYKLLERLRLAGLLTYLHPLPVQALYMGVNGFITIALLSLLAFLTGSDFIFPSLGPTAYVFFSTPLAESARPKDAILGHAIGLACGYAAFRLALEYGQYGLANFDHGFYWPKILAAALSLASTATLLVLTRIQHAPACATTLIVSLGILSTPRDLLIIELAVLLLTAQAFVINRLAGLPYPIWNNTLHLRRSQGFPSAD
ncbi:MAG TPA: HPP family protein [Pseudolabrys sp.]|nr:HPP family protein [Pseudolabrys sp.]